MNVETRTPDPVTTAEVHKATGWLIALSILLILLGIFAIAMPTVASVTFTLVVGWILLTSGIVRVIQSFRSKPVRGFWLNLAVGIFYAIAGIYILLNPLLSTASLTLALGILFIAEGVYTLIQAFVGRSGGNHFWWLVLDGIVTLILGIMVINRWPLSALWLIGFYVGFSILLSGVSLLAVALGTRHELRKAV